MQLLLGTAWRRTVAAAITVLVFIGSTWGFDSSVKAADHELSFKFVAVNDAPASNGVKPALAMWAGGTFTPDSVDASGGYTAFDDATEVPKSILTSGTWEATEVIRWIPAEGGATYGQIHPGIVDLRINLVPDEGPVIEGAILRVNCNVGPGGIANSDPETGEKLAEGYWLTLPDGASLGPIANVGTFAPRDPILGLTVISR